MELTKKVHRSTLGGENEIGSQKVEGSTLIDSEGVTATLVTSSTVIVSLVLLFMVWIILSQEFMHRLVDRQTNLFKNQTYIDT